MSKELYEKRAKMVADARAALDEITKNTDESRSAELEKRHDDIMADFDKLEKVIDREERVAAAEKREEETRARRRPISDSGVEGRGTDDGERPLEYRAVFHKFLSRGGDPSELTSEERSVLRRGVDTRAQEELRAQSFGTNTAGGYTVPTELDNQVIISMKAWGPMYDDAICTVMNTGSGAPIALPTVDDTANATTAARAENAAMVDDGSGDVTFGKKDLNAFVFATPFIRWSFELGSDSIINVEALLGSLVGERLGRLGNTQLTTGSGAGAPNGIVTASTLGKTAASATAITWDEIIDLEHSVDPAYRSSPKARYMFNDSTLQACRKLKDGQGNYLWQMGNVQNGIPGSFNGRPYSINQAMPSIATGNKVMLFGDFGKYFVRKVGGTVIGVLRERFWPDLGIAGLMRFDGELGDAAAVKHLKLA